MVGELLTGEAVVGPRLVGWLAVGAVLQDPHCVQAWLADTIRPSACSKSSLPLSRHHAAVMARLAQPLKASSRQLVSEVQSPTVVGLGVVGGAVGAVGAPAGGGVGMTGGVGGSVPGGASLYPKFWTDQHCPGLVSSGSLKAAFGPSPQPSSPSVLRLKPMPCSSLASRQEPGRYLGSVLLSKTGWR